MWAASYRRSYLRTSNPVAQLPRTQRPGRQCRSKRRWLGHAQRSWGNVVLDFRNSCKQQKCSHCAVDSVLQPFKRSCSRFNKSILQVPLDWHQRTGFDSLGPSAHSRAILQLRKEYLWCGGAGLSLQIITVSKEYIISFLVSIRLRHFFICHAGQGNTHRV